MLPDREFVFPLTLLELSRWFDHLLCQTQFIFFWTNFKFINDPFRIDDKKWSTTTAFLFCIVNCILDWIIVILTCDNYNYSALKMSPLEIYVNIWWKSESYCSEVLQKKKKQLLLFSMKKDIIQNVDNRIQGNTCETENSGFLYQMILSHTLESSASVIIFNISCECYFLFHSFEKFCLGENDWMDKIIFLEQEWVGVLFFSIFIIIVG